MREDGDVSVSLQGITMEDGRKFDTLKIEVTRAGGAHVDSVTPPVPAGYTFGGWYLDPDFKYLYDFGAEPVPYGTLILYAKMIPENAQTATPEPERNVDNSGETTSPKTGDAASPGFYLTLMLASLAAVVATCLLEGAKDNHISAT